MRARPAAGQTSAADLGSPQLGKQEHSGACLASHGARGRRSHRKPIGHPCGSRRDQRESPRRAAGTRHAPRIHKSSRQSPPGRCCHGCCRRCQHQYPSAQLRRRHKWRLAHRESRQAPWGGWKGLLHGGDSVQPGDIHVRGSAQRAAQKAGLRSGNLPHSPKAFLVES